MIPKGLRFMAAGALAFSAMSALAKVASASVPLFEIVLARSLFMVAVTSAQLRSRGLDFFGPRRGLLLLRGVLGFAGLTCFYFAVARLPLADATVLHFTNPIFVFVIAAVFLGEPMTRTELTVAIGSLAGVVVLAHPAFLFGGVSALDPVAVAVGLLGAAFAGGAYVMVRRLREEPSARVVFAFAAVSTALSAPAVLVHPVMPSPTTALVLLGVGVTTHLGQVFITLGYRMERAGRASLMGYLQILFAAGWGWAVFGTVPDAWTWVGAAVIVTGAVILARSRPASA